MINVAVMEGWANGPWHSRDFAEALKKAGFNVTDPPHADVLFAHSTACYNLPVKSPVNIYFLIDPPYWPGKPLWSRLFAKKHNDSRISLGSRGWRYLFQKTLWEAVYIFLKPQYTQSALQNHGKLDFLSRLKGKQVVIIRNERDDFCSPDIQVALAGYPYVRFAVLPGAHDDYMVNPQPYIDLLYKAI